MKKNIIFVLFFSISFLYGQNSSNFNIGDSLKDLYQLNSFINRFPGNFFDDWSGYLCKYNKDELRIIRNAIYAKYGYIFNSFDLKEYFSQFTWYEGINKNVNDKLTKNDWDVINFIRLIENNYPTNIPEELIGVWRADNRTANYDHYNSDWWFIYFGEGEFILSESTLRFWPNGIFVYLIPYNEERFYGLWTLEDGIFKLTFYFIEFTAERKIVIDPDDHHEYYSSYNIVFDPAKHHKYYTTNFERKINFFNNKINVWNEAVWECNFQIKEPSWKKVTNNPFFIPADR